MKAIIGMCASGLVAIAIAGCVTRVVERPVADSATVVTTTPSATVITTTPVPPPCGGAWSPTGGTSFGACAK
jgi:hypothetical protein